MRSPTAMSYALLGVGVEQGDLDLAAVAGIHRPGRVDDRDAVLGGEAAARHDERHVAVGQGDPHAGADERAPAGFEAHRLGGHQVGAGVTGVRVGRNVGGDNEDVHRFSHPTRVMQKTARSVGVGTRVPRAARPVAVGAGERRGRGTDGRPGVRAARHDGRPRRSAPSSGSPSSRCWSPARPSSRCATGCCAPAAPTSTSTCSATRSSSTGEQARHARGPGSTRARGTSSAAGSTGSSSSP